MTRTVLGQAYRLTKELKMWEQELADLTLLKSQTIDGMPFQNTGEVSDKTAEMAIKIIERTEMVEAIRFVIEERKNEITQFIAELDDSYLRQIVYYRCIRFFSWTKIGLLMDSSPDTVRMYYNRHIEP